MLIVGRGGRIICRVGHAYDTLENRGAPYVAIRKSNYFELSHRNIFRLRWGQFHTFLRPRENAARTSSHIAPPPKTDPQSARSSAHETRIHKYVKTSTTSRSPYPAEKCTHQNMHDRFPVHEFRCMRMPSHGSHRLRTSGRECFASQIKCPTNGWNGSSRSG